MPTATTPVEITQAIRDFCSTIVEGSEPLYVDVVPDPTAVPAECFSNVLKHKNAHGGSVALGWVIWQHHHILLEAEFHAMWKRPDGTLVDVTPPIDNEKTLLFLPDDKRSFNFDAPKRTSSRRVALVEDANLNEYLKWVAELDRIKEAYPIDISWKVFGLSDAFLKSNEYIKRAYQAHGVPTPEPPIPIETLMAFAKTYRYRQIDPYWLCPCGSGKKYKFCCRESDRS